MAQGEWLRPTDPEFVLRILEGVQGGIATAHGGPAPGADRVEIRTADTANALALLLAQLLEASGEAGTPAGMRKLSEAAGKQLLWRMKRIRESGGGLQSFTVRPN